MRTLTVVALIGSAIFLHSKAKKKSPPDLVEGPSDYILEFDYLYSESGSPNTDLAIEPLFATLLDVTNFQDVGETYVFRLLSDSGYDLNWNNIAESIFWSDYLMVGVRIYKNEILIGEAK